MTHLLRALKAAEPVRLYLYGLTVPGMALAVAYGLTTASHAALWSALAAAVLVPGVTELARANVTPTPSTGRSVRLDLDADLDG